MRARYYNPAVGRFTQEDTYRGDGLNLYAYCGNNPVMYYDPSGHNCDDNTSSDFEDTNAKKVSDNNVGSNKPLSEMDDGELAELGYKRYDDGSVRNSKGQFAGNSGTIPGTPGVNKAEAQLIKDGYKVKGREISVRSSADNKLRRYDIVVEDESHNFIGIEVKSGSARRTSQQKRIDDELKTLGGLNTVGTKADDLSIKRIVDVKEIHIDIGGNITME